MYSSMANSSSNEKSTPEIKPQPQPSIELCLLKEEPLDLEYEEVLEQRPFSDHGSPSSQYCSSTKSSYTSSSIKRPSELTDHVLLKIAKRMEQPMAPTPTVKKPKQEHDAFGEHIAEKLRSLPAPMVPFCQKLINDAIFFAEMQALNISSRILTPQELVPPPTTKPDSNDLRQSRATNH